MAKRKRLIPPVTTDLEATSILEDKGMFGEASVSMVQGPARKRLSPGAAPIADMAGAAAARSALEEVSAELTSAREEGRLVQKLRSAQIDPAHLMRDRVVIDEEELRTLMTSIRFRGQQTPIEVLETGPNQYGLISGSRRLAALSRLYDETRDEKFAYIQALVRRPLSAQQAYVAMVEENEVRVGLSYYERAQIVARTVEAGVYPNSKKALQDLFTSASRAKRSKIKSFLLIVEKLGSFLRYPTAIGERLGLELSQRLEDADFASTLCTALSEQAVHNAEDEQEVIAKMFGSAPEISGTASKSMKSADPAGEELLPGVRMVRRRSGVTLTGAGVTDEFVVRLRVALSNI